jgi:FkbM family methyltransferase
MSLLIAAYAKIIYFMFIFLLRLTYHEPDTTKESFSAAKHSRMITMSKLAEKIFVSMTWMISNKLKYEYTIAVDFEGLKILIRPFILFEIIMVSGLWEPYVKLILDQELKKTDTVVDIGANIGVYAIPLAKKVRKVIAFEPDPVTAGILEKSVRLNQLDNITVVKKLVGNSNGKARFGLSKIPMVSSVTATDHLESVVEIETVDLDSFLIMESRIDWLLIDVEGYETKVLDGARDILLKDLPKIIVELSPSNLDHIQEMLTKIGYSITQIYDGPVSSYYYATQK